MKIELTNESMKAILRSGLATQSQGRRATALSTLHKAFPDITPERTIVEVALKDTSVTYDDIEEIMEGLHYQKYVEANVKAEKEMLEAQRLLKEESDEFDYMKYHEEEGDSNDRKLPIIDTTGYEEKAFLDVDVADIIEYQKKGDYYSGDSDAPRGNAKKVLSALDNFKKLSPVDQKDVIDSINRAVEVAKQRQKGAPSKVKYVEEVNRQLSYEERVMLVTIFVKKNNVFNKQ